MLYIQVLKHAQEINYKAKMQQRLQPHFPFSSFQHLNHSIAVEVSAVPWPCGLSVSHIPSVSNAQH